MNGIFVASPPKNFTFLITKFIMDIIPILESKSLKPKQKTEAISKLLLEKKIGVADLLKQAQSFKDSGKATCIESVEYATKQNPKLATRACLNYVAVFLTEKAPRVKWESARVIGNIVHLFPEKLDEVIKNLLVNTEFPGTVVRWSSAYALGEIVKLKTSYNKELIPAIKAIIKREEQNSIRKIYEVALKKVEEKI
jgi:hypothetical protein